MDNKQPTEMLQTTGLKLVRVADLTLDGVTCTIPADDIVDIIGDDESEYTVRLYMIPQYAFDAMPEFGGW